MWDAQADTSAQLCIHVFGVTFGVTFGVRERSRQESVCVCVQVAQLELEAQRVELEQEDAAQPSTSSEAMQRLQQQVCLSCLYSVSIWTWVYLRLHCQLSSLACKSAHSQPLALVMAIAHLHS